MWLPLMLLALTASGSFQCELPSFSEKYLIAHLDWLDIYCGGDPPSLSQLPKTTTGLTITNAKESDVYAFLDELKAAELANDLGMNDTSDNFKMNDTSKTNDTSTSEESTGATEILPNLVSFACMSCSLVSFNMSWHGFERLKTLYLVNNKLPRVQNVLMIRTMNLSELTYLDLSGNLLSDLSADSFRTLVGLVQLHLNDNNIVTVDENAFRGLDRLEFLELTHNKLTDLPDRVFTPLYSLQKLNLRRNQLQVLGVRWFENLDKLRELNLSRNRLTKPASGMLQSLLSILWPTENPLKERDVSLLLCTGSRLETVDLSHTGLTRVPATLTRSIRTLKLTYNNLTTIRSGDFDSYPLLRLLDISYNQLINIENDALGRLEVLEELDLSKNALSKIPSSLPSSLVMLNLQGNAITALKLDDLNGLYNLKSLMLQSNSISEIDVGSFGQLSLLTKLDLSNNPIKALPTNTLSGLSNLTNLRMTNLKSLQQHQEEQSDMAFPMPTPERLVSLYVSGSPVLARQLLADDAALSACKSLTTLDLSNTNISTIRSDIVYMLPELHFLNIYNNKWNCTEDQYWLGEWFRQYRRADYNTPPQCFYPPKLKGLYLHNLPPPNFVSTTAGIVTTAAASTSVTLSVVFTLEHTSNTDQPNVTVSPNIEDENSDGNVTDLFMLSSVNAKTESKTVADSDFLSTTETVTATTAPKKIPPIYEAPTSFRNVTSSITMQMSEEPDRKSNKTNRTSRDQNLMKQIVVPTSRAPRKPKLTIKRMEDAKSRPQTFDNRTDGGTARKNGTMSKVAVSGVGEILSSRSSNVGRKTIEKHSNSTSNATKTVLEDGHDSKTIAEELNSRATDSGARVSEALSAGAHPGMLVLVGAALGAVAALTVVLSRRATVHRTDRYHRHENIEVHTLTPITELW
ncbi:toll-like receptor 6 [Monomorium pharaonis]|uniref:toll-like receptor 6 n=1 Tax=Monomorium pharaonis TaxID=307658 RepID=UPI00063EFEDB|nr:toll-like receptor 6 [Monomorium pharaonis]